MRARQSPELGRKKFGAAVRGRSEGHQHLDPCAARIWQAVQGQKAQLDVSDRTRTGTGRANRVSAARQGLGRIKFDQRPALRSGPARGLRSLASAWQRWMGL